MGSPRPTCKSVWLRASVCPPSWRMATSNETRVRVEGFSKISISTAPAMPLGVSSGGTVLPAFFMARPISTMRRSVAASIRSRSRKCRGAMAHPPRAPVSGRLGKARKRSIESPDGLAKLGFRDVERGQQAHHVVAGTHGQELLLHAGVDDLAQRRLDL